MLEFIKGCYFTLTSQHDERKKKTKKTQKVQYDDDDNHPFHTNAIGNGGVTIKRSFPSNAVVGAAGENLVLSHLLRLNYIAGLAPYNTKDYDLIILSED